MTHIEDLPKVSLHEHLDGALRPETLIELAADRDITLPESDPDDLADWFLDTCSRGDLEGYLRAFELTVSVMQTSDELRRVANEFVLDLWDDGVVYAEVRWAPEQHLREGLTMREAVEAVREGIADGVREVRSADGVDMEVRQILCAMRNSDQSRAVAELAVRERERGIVGFDLAGPEAGYPASDHASAISLLASEHFPITIHAGEAAGLESIDDAIVSGRALRLGHATHLEDDLRVTDAEDGHTLVELGRTASWVRDREIALECCPSSNMQTGAFVDRGDGLENHPFDLFYRLGMRVTVNPDNRLMSDTTLSQELALLVETFDYTVDDLREFQVNAAMAAFLPLDERLDLVSLIDAGFEAFEQE